MFEKNLLKNFRQKTQKYGFLAHLVFRIHPDITLCRRGFPQGSKFFIFVTTNKYTVTRSCIAIFRFLTKKARFSCLARVFNLSCPLACFFLLKFLVLLGQKQEKTSCLALTVAKIRIFDVKGCHFVT